MTDPTPTPTRAEVERLCFHMRRQWPVGPGNMVVLDALKEAETMLSRLLAGREALRERAEAAEAEATRLEMACFNQGVSISYTQAALTAARRAETVAWNNAIEAVRHVALASFASGCDAHELDEDIRALRRAAPTEGEA